MSAFLVGHQTIDAVVSLKLQDPSSRKPISLETAQKLGRSLWLLNALALEDRYEQETANDYLETIGHYQWTPRNDAIPVLLKSARCFLYQCSEGDVPETALYQEITDLCDSFKDRGWERTAEYDGAPWGLCG